MASSLRDHGASPKTDNIEMRARYAWHDIDPRSAIGFWIGPALWAERRFRPILASAAAGGCAGMALRSALAAGAARFSRISGTAPPSMRPISTPANAPTS